MIARKHLPQRDHIAITLSHLLAINGDHVVVDPIIGRLYMIANSALRNFTFVMWKQQIHSSAMNVEALAEIFRAHGRAFNMPSWETFPPWALPTHDVFWWCFFP